MVAIESVATLVSALVLALIILLKIVRRNIQSRRINHDIDLLASEESRTHTRKDFEILQQGLKSGSIRNKTGSSASFVIQAIFGWVVFAGFSGWTYHLWQGAFIELAAVSAIIALVGLAMPFVIWSVTKKRNIRLAQIDAGLIKIESKLSAQPVKTHAAPKPEAKIFQQAEQPKAEPIPQDSLLKRHYLAHKAAEIEAIVNPYPTDSVLRRHYEQLLQTRFEAEVQKRVQELTAKTQAASKPETKVFQQAEQPKAEPIPQDSVLRRHYLAHKAAENEAIVNPYPTDSVLRRHYEQLLQTGFSAEVQRLAQELTVETESMAQTEESNCMIPEESVLKRHFLYQLRAEIEATLFPRPTDSILKRHFEALVESKLENRLAHFH